MIHLLWLLTAIALLAQPKPLVYQKARSQAPPLTMEMVTPDGPGPFPVVLLVHGGGFSGGSPESMRTFSAQLRRSGLASALVTYRLAPRFQFPSPVQDLKAAVQYLKANAATLHIRPDQICAAGQEAGATLVELLAAQEPLRCAVAFDGIPGTPAFLGTTEPVPAADPANWRSPTPMLRSGDPVPFLKKHLLAPPDRFTVLAADHGTGAELLAIGWPSGRVLWRVPNGTGLDVQALPQGHVLFTDHVAHKVIEIDANQKTVWSLGAEAGLQTPFSVRRLTNGNTLVTDSKGARVTEFTPDGKIAWQWAKPELEPMWPRMSRPTEKGTVLVAFQKGGTIYEIDRAGNSVWQFQIDPSRLPYQGLRLANGNTLIGLVDPGEIIEVNPAGKVVRSIGGASSKIRLGWIAGIATLPNGGLMIADFTARRLVEVDAAGNLVHELRDLPWNIASIAVQ